VVDLTGGHLRSGRQTVYFKTPQGQ